MKSTIQRARKLANDALDGMNVSKTTLANELLKVTTMLERELNANTSRNVNPMPEQPRPAPGPTPPNPFGDMFGGIFGK